MSYLEGVPFRVTISFVDDPVGDTNFAGQMEIELPESAEILTCTMPDFSLEKKVLYWIDSASRQEIPWFNGTASTYPTAPPCWLLLVDSKENVADSHKATSCKTKEMSRLQSCMNLGTRSESLRCPGSREKTTREDLDQCPEEQEGSEDKESSSATSEEHDSEEPSAPMPGALPQLFDLPQSRPKTSPGHLTAASESSCPRSLLGKQRQSTYFLNNVKNELQGAKKKLLAIMHPLNGTTTDSALVSKAFSLHQHSRSNRNFRFGVGSPPGLTQTLIPSPPPTSCCKSSQIHSAEFVRPIQHHKPTVASLSPYACLPPPPGTQQPLSPHRAPLLDSTSDLLSVLSQEERELIEPMVALGYPIRRAILALQKTGRQSLGQFLSYLSACDRLLKQGYDEAQVIEAMEMFQNSEKKASEFLCLLAQFNDMGFQQADIKEVLLLCENHRDRALEELMAQSQ
ncbi:ubiquitin-associated protein 1-like [Thamnophis elegans]|uniref:ubiquitin-associated protein 1-like n=1 Tax=Thamnophis elegans TaxID=35005 RepID=UPI001376D26C|nr:ubiquitin-associated protein 1-like [Thamnophis elegans]